jgi:hypothetical protein
MKTRMILTVIVLVVAAFGAALYGKTQGATAGPAPKEVLFTDEQQKSLEKFDLAATDLQNAFTLLNQRKEERVIGYAAGLGLTEEVLASSYKLEKKPDGKYALIELDEEGKKARAQARQARQ